MTISARCTGCNRHLETTDDRAGTTMCCPTCHAWVPVPILSFADPHSALAIARSALTDLAAMLLRVDTTIQANRRNEARTLIAEAQQIVQKALAETVAE